MPGDAGQETRGTVTAGVPLPRDRSTPRVRRTPPPGKVPASGCSSDRSSGTLDLKSASQPQGGAGTATPLEKGTPCPGGETLPPPGWSRDPRDPLPEGPGVAGARAPHSPSARPQAAPTAARKRSICVSLLLSGSHITWHSMISSRPGRACLDMAARAARAAPGTESHGAAVGKTEPALLQRPAGHPRGHAPAGPSQDRPRPPL